MCFCQLIGIAMEFDPASFMVNLFFKPGKVASLNKKQDLQKRRMFSDFFTFVSRLCSLNNDEFGNNYNDIYLDELELKKENDDPCKVMFFDLLVEAHGTKY